VTLPPALSLPEIERLSVTTVVDNFIDSLRANEKIAKRFTLAQARRMPTLKAEHGLGHWVEVERGGETRRIAFDFGLTGESYTHNFLELGLDAGGFHLSGLAGERITQVVDAFRTLGVEYLIPQHCTGLEAVIQMGVHLPNELVVSSVGSTFTFGV